MAWVVPNWPGHGHKACWVLGVLCVLAVLAVLVVLVVLVVLGCARTRGVPSVSEVAWCA